MRLMPHTLLASFARRFPSLSRALESRRFLRAEIDSLRQELAEQNKTNQELAAKAADLHAWLDIITNKWYDRSKATFDADGIIVTGRPVAFLSDPTFQQAYRFGIEAGHHYLAPGANPSDLHIEWRVAICCWAAWHAKRLAGDFVECGVNTGIFSRAICRFIDFNTTGIRFFLFDTFQGVPLEQISDEGRRREVEEFNKLHYPDVWDAVQKNFSEFPNARPIRGRVPEGCAADWM